MRPPLEIFPARAKTFVPLLFSEPYDLNASAPFKIIHGINESVSTLLTRVGLSLNPLTAG